MMHLGYALVFAALGVLFVCTLCAINPRDDRPAWKRPALDGWFEEYRCGCVSEIVRFKKELVGYCGTHGDNRRAIFPTRIDK